MTCVPREDPDRDRENADPLMPTQAAAAITDCAKRLQSCRTLGSIWRD